MQKGSGSLAPEDDLRALQEEDVPDAQQVVEGQGVCEQCDEPMRAEHGRVHPLPPEVCAHPRHLHPTATP